jgi:NADH-quinone oxidoreductase subunit B
LGVDNAASKPGTPGIVTTTLDALVNWGRTRAMWPVLFGLACCAIEMMSTQASHYDLSRFGMELMRASPRQSDLMIVAGRVSRKMAPVVRRLYDQMPHPKWVIAMGDCASCGGIFNNYAILQGVDEIVPVDVYIAGCPPRPEQLMHGIITLHEKVKGETITDWATWPFLRGKEETA